MSLNPADFIQYGAMGLLALVLFGGGIGLGYAIRWLAHNFLTPIKDAHIVYLETTAAALSELPAIKQTIDKIDTKTTAIHDQVRKP